MAEFPMSHKVMPPEVHPALQGQQHQQGDESAASVRLLRSRGTFSDAQELIYFPKCTQASHIIQESICPCLTNWFMPGRFSSFLLTVVDKYAHIFAHSGHSALTTPAQDLPMCRALQGEAVLLLAEGMGGVIQRRLLVHCLGRGS